MVQSWLSASAVAVLLMPFFVAPSQAGILAVVTNAIAQHADDNDKHQLALDDNGDTSVTFQAEPNVPTIFTFNAECVANGPGGSFLTINITVDGHQTNPHAAHDRPFCSSGTQISAVHMTTFTFTRGHEHTIMVFATGVGTGAWRIGNSLLSVQD